MSGSHSRQVSVPTADAMRDLGAQIGRRCQGGDLVVLSGELGAGKTTFTQGIGRGLGIEEPVTSPTFVIARTHANPVDAPDLVHVDAYRVRSSLELDDLDLETDLDRSVVVVEWGTGLAEALSASRLDVAIERAHAANDDVRIVTLTAHGGRWCDLLADRTWPA